MDFSQISAIDATLNDLINSLEQITPIFLANLEIRNVISFSERQIVQSETTSKAQLVTLIAILKTKDSAWPSIIDFLITNNIAQLAQKLIQSASAANPQQLQNVKWAKSAEFTPSKPTLLEEISLLLANYYKLHYCHIRTMWENHQHVKDIWVQLELEEKTKSEVETDRFDPESLIERLISGSTNVALIRGDPGVGKTTLVKKLAYDWAERHSDLAEYRFSLLVAVPLRSVGAAKTFLQLAAEFIDELFDVDYTVDELVSMLKSLGPKLLICLDGLDEYNNYAESPFKSLFAQPFEQPSHHSRNQPKFISFKMIITSRPYACELINREFFPIRMQICPIDSTRLIAYIQRYCQTANGVASMTKYVTNYQLNLVITIPLILTFACFLADSNEEIPNNLTLLYTRLIRHMLMREHRESKLAETIDIANWIDSKLIRSTMELAFEGCKMQTLEFSNDLIKRCGVTNDSFTCGFLLHKFNFKKESLMSEFVHKSIQEFFAAYHCYSLLANTSKIDNIDRSDVKQKIDRSDILKQEANRSQLANQSNYDDTDESDLIRQEIYRSDSQFCRFLFALCSQGSIFDDMLIWLSPTFADFTLMSYAFDAYLKHLSIGLSDCTDANGCKFGSCLLPTVDEVEKKVISNSRAQLLRFAVVSEPSENLRTGLNIQIVPRTTRMFVSWFIPDPEHKNIAKLAYNFGQIGTFKLAQIQLLWWKTTVLMDLEQFEFERLPPIRTLVISCGSDREIFYNIAYSEDIAERQFLLQNLSFSIAQNIVKTGKFMQNPYDQTAVEWVDIERKTDNQQSANICWVTVKVLKYHNQADLIANLLSKPFKSTWFYD